MINDSFSNAVKNPFFVHHTFIRTQVLFLDPLFSTHIDFMDDLNEEVYEPIGNFFSTHHAQGGKQGQTFGLWMGIHAGWFFDTSPVAVDLEDTAGDASKEIVRQSQFPTTTHSCHFFEHSCQPDSSRVFADLFKRTGSLCLSPLGNLLGYSPLLSFFLLLKVERGAGLGQERLQRSL